MKNSVPSAVQTYRLDYLAEAHAVRLCWLVPYTLREVRASYQAALALARRYGCARWLLDARLAGPLDVCVADWLTQKFLPMAALRLAPQPLQLAIVTSATRLEQLGTDATVGRAVTTAMRAPHPYTAHFFREEEAAMTWLLGERGWRGPAKLIGGQTLEIEGLTPDFKPD